MICPDCHGYRHEGPCPDLHADYMSAFEAMMVYMAKTDPSHRTMAQTNELSRLTSICDMAKYKFETAQMREWQHEPR